MAQTTIQLFELNQRTLSQWFCRRQKAWERTVLEQGTGIVPAPVVAVRPLPAAKQLSLVQVGQGQPFIFPGPSAGGQPAPPHPHPAAFGSAAVAAASAAAATVVAAAAAPPPPPPPHPPAFGSAPAAPPLPGQTKLPRTTAYRKRKAAEAAAAAAAGEGPPLGTKVRRQTAQYTCSKCGQLKRLDTGHTRIAGVSYCAAVGGMTVEEWRENMRRPPEERE
ncbi:atherin-like [Acanthochromis polyacanthus]|uniref:atherin-like n=1 Tax=Acanthochromis polyacanthus TaxID=80966 RepID=UPI002234382C|nr:atherin-like [Acanthochromis polyacanthus]